MTTITRYIPHREFLIYLWVGWTIQPLSQPHGRYRFLATREPVT